MLLRNATVATLEPPRVEPADLRIEGGLVAERGPSLAGAAGEETLDLEGALVVPGLVNAHTHLYSALARGMPGPAEPPRTFVEILEGVWWRLDRALDEDSIRLSGLVGAIEAARSGTTTVFDHHASPSWIRGSLGTLRQAVEEVGLRSVLCYETTDRNGLAGRDEGVSENRSFLAAGETPLTRGMVGAHASFTLSDESLALVARASRLAGTGVHVHAAEDRADVEDAVRRGAAGVVDRLRRHGLVGPGALLVHAVHLAPHEVEAAQAEGARLVHCPRSNANNAVGRAPTGSFARAALGTDGMDEDMLAEARAAFLGMRSDGRDDALAATLRMLAEGHRLAAEHFSLPIGRLEPGAAADLVVLDYRSPTPLSGDNLGAHLLFGLDRSHVRSTMVAGRFVLRERRVTAVDEDAVFGRAGRVAAALWNRMR